MPRFVLQNAKRLGFFWIIGVFCAAALDVLDEQTLLRRTLSSNEAKVEEKNQTSSYVLRALPESRCDIQQQQSISTKESPSLVISGDMWDVQILLSQLLPEARYHIRLLDKSTAEKEIWANIIGKEDCQIYQQNGESFMSYYLELEYFRACRMECHKPRTGIAKPSLKISLLLSNRITHDLDPVICEEEYASAQSTPELYSLNILNPSSRKHVEAGPFDLQYLLSRKERSSPCELRALNLSIGARLHTRIETALGICDRETLIRVDPPPPPGTHTLELMALGPTGAPLAIGRIAFTHLGHRPADDPDAVCLLSYSQSGNHLLRFLIEYLTARPTAGCCGNLDDRPIHNNEFPPPHRPLGHVDPWAPPAAFKFHYSGRAAAEQRASCILPATGCRRLVLLVRDFGKCIPRYFEGRAESTGAAASTGPASFEAVDDHADLYLENLDTFAAFTGPRLLVRYEDLVANHSAAAAVADFFAQGSGTATAQALGVRRAALELDYEGLLALSRGAEGRSWIGVRRAASSYLRGWSNVHICHLARRFEEVMRPGPEGGRGGEPEGVVREVLRGYEESLRLLQTACSFV
jgi:hypothetical protein